MSEVQDREPGSASEEPSDLQGAAAFERLRELLFEADRERLDAVEEKVERPMEPENFFSRSARRFVKNTTTSNGAVPRKDRAMVTAGIGSSRDSKSSGAFRKAT